MTSFIQNNAENQTAGWIAEWAGPVGKEACIAGVTAGTGLSRGPASVVVDYVRKSAIISVPELLSGFGGKALEGLGATNTLVPYEVEKLLQTDLDEVIKDVDALLQYEKAGFTKVTHVTTLFFKAQHLVLQDLNLMSRAARFERASWRDLQDPFGMVQAPTNQWIVKLDEPVGFGKIEEEQDALVPHGAEISPFVDHAYTIFARACVPKDAMAPIHMAETRCQEKVGDDVLLVDYRDEPEEHPSPIFAAYYFMAGGTAAAVQWKFPAVCVEA